MVARFVGLMEERHWIYDLPGDSLESHYFDEGMSQLTGSVGTQWKVGDEQMKISEEELKASEEERKLSGSEINASEQGKEKSNLKRKGGVLEALDTNKLNRKPTGIRQPKKRVMGQKPFKPPTMTVLGNICNEALR